MSKANIGTYYLVDKEQVENKQYVFNVYFDSVTVVEQIFDDNSNQWVIGNIHQTDRPNARKQWKELLELGWGQDD